MLSQFSGRFLRRFATQTAFEVKTAEPQKTEATKKLTPKSKDVIYKDFPIAFPDFMPNEVWNRRDPLYEELIQMDMMERRAVLDVPEFYVGSIMAVTLADNNLAGHKTRFVGICIERQKCGLHHQFTLRNVIDGLGVEIMYELYNPTILKIEVLKLERRLDESLTYLIDALPEYSTFNFEMEPVAHPAGAPVPVNPLKVELRSPPWKLRWSAHDFKGIADSWTLSTPYMKRKLAHAVGHPLHLHRYDLIRHYRSLPQELEHDLKVQKRMQEFEKSRQKIGGTKRRILRLVSVRESSA